VTFHSSPGGQAKLIREKAPQQAGDLGQPGRQQVTLRSASGSARQRELEAIDEWDNEGGASRRDSVADRSPNVSWTGTPQYLNDVGVREIRIGARDFHCIGALPPHDHPHIYLRMGERPAILCPYCSTTYIYDRRLRPDETEPDGCFFLSPDVRDSSLSRGKVSGDTL
jgi:uncharacterized Zn-finger protein